MKSILKASRTLSVLVGLGAISCVMADDGSYDLSGSGEDVATETQEFNPVPPTSAQPFKGHHEITKRAMLYLAQHNLLPLTLGSVANQNLVLYGNEFGDHSYLGRPESPTTSVPTRQTANRAMYSSDQQSFQFEIPNPKWESPDVNTNVKARVGWYGKGSEWQNPDGTHPELVNPRMAQSALHFQVDMEVSVDVWFDWLTTHLGYPG